MMLDLSKSDFFKKEEAHWWFRARKDIVLFLIGRYFKDRKGAAILDIGCGNGMIAKNLEKYGKVWGMDQDSAAVEYTKEKLPEAQIVLGSFPQEAPPQKFDLITMLDVLEHIEDDEAALVQIRELLNSGGLALITVPAYKFLWTGHDVVSSHKRRYNAKDLEDKIKNAGLKIEKISHYNTFLFLPTAAVKIAQRFTGKERLRSHIDSPLPPAPIGGFLRLIFSAEKYCLPWVGFPIGISIVAIVRKL